MGGSRPESERMLHVAERMESSTYTYNSWNRGVAPTTPPDQDIPSEEDWIQYHR